MKAVARGPDRESEALVPCPDCSGTGRVGESRTPCRTCWCRGVVPIWKWRQIMEGRNGGTPGRAAAATATVPKPRLPW